MTVPLNRRGLQVSGKALGIRLSEECACTIVESGESQLRFPLSQLSSPQRPVDNIPWLERRVFLRQTEATFFTSPVIK